VAAGSCCCGVVEVWGPDDQIVDPVAIDVASGRHAIACNCTGCFALNGVSVGGGQCAQPQNLTGAAGLAVNDVGPARVVSTARQTNGSDDHVVDPVAVHVTRRRNAAACQVIRCIALNDKAVTVG